MPTHSRSAGCAIRLTDILAIGSKAGIPHPMSQNAPKLSRRVTLASTTSPGRRSSMYSRRHFSCAARREHTARRRPSSVKSNPVTRKLTGLLTREMSAISRVVPSAMPTAPSSLGITPCIHGSSTCRLWSLSHKTARASTTCPSMAASASALAVPVRRRFAVVLSKTPSGKNSFILTAIPFFRSL